MSETLYTEEEDVVRQPLLSTDGTFGAGFESSFPALAESAKKVNPQCLRFVGQE